MRALMNHVYEQCGSAGSGARVDDVWVDDAVQVQDFGVKLIMARGRGASPQSYLKR